jgi:hypothetical protein
VNLNPTFRLAVCLARPCPAVLHLLLCLLACAAISGCNSLGNAKLVQELRNENERLLAEFRAERDKREKLERDKALVENRLAESEKLLARSYSGSLPSRLSSLPRYDQSTAPGPLGGSSGTNQGLSADGWPESQAGQGGSGLRWQRRD